MNMALKEIETAESLFDLIPEETIKECFGISEIADVNEDSVSIYSAFRIEDDGAETEDGKLQVTLGGFDLEAFVGFVIIYLPTGPVGSAGVDGQKLLASDGWKILSPENVTVNQDGSVTMLISEFGSYVIVVAEDKDVVNDPDETGNDETDDPIIDNSETESTEKKGFGCNSVVTSGMTVIVVCILLSLTFVRRKGNRKDMKNG